MGIDILSSVPKGESKASQEALVALSSLIQQRDPAASLVWVEVEDVPCSHSLSCLSALPHPLPGTLAAGSR